METLIQQALSFFYPTIHTAKRPPDNTVTLTERMRDDGVDFTTNFPLVPCALTIYSDGSTGHLIELKAESLAGSVAWLDGRPGAVAAVIE